MTTTAATIIMSYCPTCGAPHKLFAICKGCGVKAIRGTMDEMLAIQNVRAAATPKPAPSSASDAEYVRACRAARSEQRRADLAKMTSARSSRPVWQRRCTCGHCMDCIGE